MIGDTDFFVDLMRSKSPFHQRARTFAEDLAQRGVPLHMTAVTRFELQVSIALAQDSEKARGRVETLLSAYPTLPLDEASADRGGRALGSLMARGRPIGSRDAMIAGIALQRAEELATRNVAEFSRVEGLQLATY